MTEPAQQPDEQTPDATPTKQHGDPLLDAAEGRGDGEGSRHGHDATGALGDRS